MKSLFLCKGIGKAFAGLSAEKEKKNHWSFASGLNRNRAGLMSNVFENLSFDFLMTTCMMDYCKPFICRNKCSKEKKTGHGQASCGLYQSFRFAERQIYNIPPFFFSLLENHYWRSFASLFKFMSKNSTENWPLGIFLDSISPSDIKP